MWLRMLMMRVMMIAAPLALLVGASHLGVKLPFADVMKQQLQFAQAAMGFGDPQKIIGQIVKPRPDTKRKPVKKKVATADHPVVEPDVSTAVPASDGAVSEASVQPAALPAAEATPDAS